MSFGRGAGANERVLSAVRAQLREAARDVLANALDQLESGARSRPASARSGHGDQAERMREVLERDRALAAALQMQVQAAPPATSPEPPQAPVFPACEPACEPATPECNEPIRTRTMAKLLAAQGHPDRALGIYLYLRALEGPDPALNAAIAALLPAPTLDG